MAKEKTIELSDLQFDDKNANKHTDEGLQLLEKSITENKFGRSILLDKDGRIIAGNGVVESAKKLGHQKVRVIETEGDELIAVQRKDLSLDSKEGRSLAIADNSIAAKDLEWDEENLKAIQEEWDIDIEDWGVELPEGEDINPDDYGESFSLPSGEKSPFGQMTFTLADEQISAIQQLIADVKETEEYKYVETFGNENGNGNAIYLICKLWERSRTLS